MLSRIADALFWMNRYMERAEGLLRTVRTNYILSLDKSPYGVHSWRPVLKIFATLSEEELQAIEYNTSKSVYYLCMEKQNPNSLQQIIAKARENARGIQDNITKEVWEQVNQLYHLMNQPQTEKIIAGEDPMPVIDKLLNGTLQFVGVVDTTMSRDMSWSFMNMGKLLERCLLTIETMLSHFGNIDFNLSSRKDILYWRSLLFSLSGYELYLKTYRLSEQNNHILHMLVFNTDFPRSIRYCFDRMEKYLVDVLAKNNPEQKDRLLRQFGKMNSLVLYADASDIKDHEVRDFLCNIRASLLYFYQQLGQTFFSYT